MLTTRTEEAISSMSRNRDSDSILSPKIASTDFADDSTQLFSIKNHHKTVFFPCQTSIIANLNSTFCQRHLTSSDLVNVLRSLVAVIAVVAAALGGVAGCEKKVVLSCSAGAGSEGLEWTGFPSATTASVIKTLQVPVTFTKAASDNDRGYGGTEKNVREQCGRHVMAASWASLLEKLVCCKNSLWS